MGVPLDVCAQHAGRTGREVMTIAQQTMGLPRARMDMPLELVTWIERTYHRRRRQRSLGKLTPIEFETIYTAAGAA